MNVFSDVHNWIKSNKETKTALFGTFNVKTQSERYDAYIDIYNKIGWFSCKKCSVGATHYELCRHEETHPYYFQLCAGPEIMTVQRLAHEYLKESAKIFFNEPEYNEDSCLLCKSCSTEFSRVQAKYKKENPRK